MIENQVIYKKRLLLYFSAVFFIFAAVLVIFQIRTERMTKKEMLKGRMDIYADIVHSCLEDGLDPTGSLCSILPKELRITLMDADGSVFYDSEFLNGSTMPSGEEISERQGREDCVLGNHYDRPEVQQALSSASGSAIRYSDTAGMPYFYYAKVSDCGIIRLALPYENEVREQFRPNILFIIIVSVIFFVSFLVIALLSGYFGYGVSQLHDRIDQEKVKYNEMKHQMTNNIAHELRTPVSSIRGYLETLTTCPDIAPERKQAFIERAYVQTIRLSDLIRDIALITKIEEASDQLVKERMCLKTVVDEVITEFRETIDAKEVRVENLLDNIHVNGNATLLYAIFRNLIENSLKYGGGHLLIHVECLSIKDGKCHLVYYDTGKGVGQEHLPRIFERFYRVSEGRTRDDGGSGLGLSIVRNAIAFHNGDITASVRQSGGLQYDFTLSVK